VLDVFLEMIFSKRRLTQCRELLAQMSYPGSLSRMSVSIINNNVKCLLQTKECVIRTKSAVTYLLKRRDGPQLKLITLQL
jgi:hypothetical protein